MLLVLSSCCLLLKCYWISVVVLLFCKVDQLVFTFVLSSLYHASSHTVRCLTYISIISLLRNLLLFEMFLFLEAICIYSGVKFLKHLVFFVHLLQFVVFTVFLLCSLQMLIINIYCWSCSMNISFYSKEGSPVVAKISIVIYTSNMFIWIWIIVSWLVPVSMWSFYSVFSVQFSSFFQLYFSHENSVLRFWFHPLIFVSLVIWLYCFFKTI